MDFIFFGIFMAGVFFLVFLVFAGVFNMEGGASRSDKKFLKFIFFASLAWLIWPVTLPLALIFVIYKSVKMTFGSD